MDTMQPQAPATGGGNLPAPNPQIMSPVVKAHMDELEQMSNMMTGKIGDAYDRVVTAGMKMLYSPDNAKMMHELIEDQDVPVPNKLGEGIANLMVMMDNTGNGTIPKEVLFPAGVTLLFEAADYLFEIGVEVTEDDLGKALELLIKGIFVGYGIDPAKMDQVVDNLGEKLGFEDTNKGEEVSEMPGEAKAETGEAAPGESGIEPMDEEAAMQQAFKADRAKQLGIA